MRKKGFYLLLSLVLTLSCGKTEETSPKPIAKIEVSSVSLNKSSLVLEKGQTETLVATVSPTNASDQSIKWSSSNSSVATVSDIGLVAGTGAGEATITATTSNGKTATCLVTVTVPVSSISLDKTSLELKMGETFQLTARVNPEDATNKSLTWSINKPSVATVNQDGLVTGISSGQATITVTSSNGKKATCIVSVTISSIDGGKIEDYDKGNGEWD